MLPLFFMVFQSMAHFRCQLWCSVKVKEKSGQGQSFRVYLITLTMICSSVVRRGKCNLVVQEYTYWVKRFRLWTFEVSHNLGRVCSWEKSQDVTNCWAAPVSHDLPSQFWGLYCCLGGLQPNERRTFNSILSDIWNIFIHWDYWAVFSVCQLL